jgi:thiopurine S-methyltransferase
MQPEFWHDRWQRQQIGFHEPSANPLLLRHFEALRLQPGTIVFVPLCGKSLDIDWLLGRGHRVTGSELSPIAATALFERLGIEPRILRTGPVPCWQGQDLLVWVGDHFALQPDTFGQADAVYDRAALIAMPADLRPAYAAQIQRLAADVPQLLVTLEYDQAAIDGPPFSVEEQELRALYPRHTPRRLASAGVDGGLKGRVPATENVWVLQPARARQ